MTNKDEALQALDATELQRERQDQTQVIATAQVFALLALSDSLDAQTKAQENANKVALLATGMLDRTTAEAMIADLLGGTHED